MPDKRVQAPAACEPPPFEPPPDYVFEAPLRHTTPRASGYEVPCHCTQTTMDRISIIQWSPPLPGRFPVP